MDTQAAQQHPVAQKMPSETPNLLKEHLRFSRPIGPLKFLLGRSNSPRTFQVLEDTQDHRGQFKFHEGFPSKKDTQIQTLWATQNAY